MSRIFPRDVFRQIIADAYSNRAPSGARTDPPRPAAESAPNDGQRSADHPVHTPATAPAGLTLNSTGPITIYLSSTVPPGTH
jgi:hypothetical protein